MNNAIFNAGDILETIRMIQDECLDIRTTTMGISLLDCIDSDIHKACDKVYDKITRRKNQPPSPPMRYSPKDCMTLRKKKNGSGRLTGMALTP